MTFEAVEESLELGEPISLYRFIYSGTIADSPDPPSYNLTDAEIGPTETIFEPTEGQDYSPASIESDSIKAGGKAEQAYLEVRVPADTNVATLFAIWPPSQPVVLRIRNGHIGQTEYPVRWTGRVTNCRWEDNVAKLTCESLATSLGRPGLRRRYGLGCPYALYDSFTCMANEAAATITEAVQSISGTTLTFTAGWNGATSASKYNGGKAYWTDGNGVQHLRTILSAGATDIKINGYPTNLSALDNVSLTLGCNRQTSDCATLHANINNFGGQFALPTSNPFEYINRFY